MEMEALVMKLSDDLKNIIPTADMRDTKLYWGGNGLGDRWANKKYNYSVIYKNKTPKVYSENEDDVVPPQVLAEFLEKNKGSGILGIYVHSKRTNIERRPISKEISNKIKSKNCVVCGTNTEIICDHKNDLYNDPRVLDINAQRVDDFQTLCNHCNLQKRQVSKDEVKNDRIYSAKNMLAYRAYPFDFPWEKKVFDTKDINCKTDTYWYDPVEFNRKIYCYACYVIPLLNEIKHKVKHNKLKLIP